MHDNPYQTDIENTRKFKKSHKGCSNPYIKSKQNYSHNGKNSKQDGFLGGFDTNGFLKGALIGASLTFLLTNEKVQKTLFKTFAKGGNLVQAGIEEMKERIEDAKAELETKE